MNMISMLRSELRRNKYLERLPDHLSFRLAENLLGSFIEQNDPIRFID